MRCLVIRCVVCCWVQCFLAVTRKITLHVVKQKYTDMGGTHQTRTEQTKRHATYPSLPSLVNAASANSAGGLKPSQTVIELGETASTPSSELVAGETTGATVESLTGDAAVHSDTSCITTSRPTVSSSFFADALLSTSWIALRNSTYDSQHIVGRGGIVNYVSCHTCIKCVVAFVRGVRHFFPQ